jgi:excisionase family DNA binding protein
MAAFGGFLLGGGAHLGAVNTTPDQAGPASAGLEPLLGTAELSELIGVPVSTIYDWRVKGQGPVAHRLGKHLRFKRADVEAWLASHRETATGAGWSR